MSSTPLIRTLDLEPVYPQRIILVLLFRGNRRSITVDVHKRVDFTENRIHLGQLRGYRVVHLFSMETIIPTRFIEGVVRRFLSFSMSDLVSS